MTDHPTPNPAAASVPGGDRRETCSAHSPLPLPLSTRVVAEGNPRIEILGAKDSEGQDIITDLTLSFLDEEHNAEQRERAAHIVKACNSYPKLVEALKEARRYFSNRPGNWEAQMVDIVMSALREAGEL